MIPLEADGQEKMQDYKEKQQCHRNEKHVERSQRRPKQQQDQERNNNGENQVQELGTLANGGSEQRGQTNTTYEEEPKEIEESSDQEEVVCKRRYAASPDYRSTSLSKKFNKPHCWEQRPRKVKQNGVDASPEEQQSLDQMSKRDTPSQIVEHDQGNILPESQENETLENDNGAFKDERWNGTGPANENSFIQQQSCPNTMEGCKCQGKETEESRVENQRKYPGKGKRNAIPTLELQILEEDQTKASSCSSMPTKELQPGNDDGAISTSQNTHQRQDLAKGKQNVTTNLEIETLGMGQPEVSSCSLKPTQASQPGRTNDAISTSQNPQEESKYKDHAPEAMESHPQEEMKEHPQNQRRAPGKTQMRLAKLLKEGKAAIDVMIIIGFFVLCYLPLWIMACYRAFGGDPSAEVILTTHCFYATTMVWNPIIYSIRKKEFRKAVKKLKKLRNCENKPELISFERWGSFLGKRFLEQILRFKMVWSN